MELHKHLPFLCKEDTVNGNLKDNLSFSTCYHSSSTKRHFIHDLMTITTAFYRLMQADKKLQVIREMLIQLHESLDTLRSEPKLVWCLMFKRS